MAFVIFCIGSVVLVRFKSLFNEIVKLGEIAVSQQRSVYWSREIVTKETKNNVSEKVSNNC